MDKKIITTLSLVSFLMTSVCYADNVIKVQTGHVVTKEYNEGVLMDREKADKVRDELIEKDALVKTNESLNKSLILYRSNEDILNGQKKLLLDQNIELTKTLNDTRETSTLVKVGYFIGGVALTGLAVYGATRLAK